MPAPPPSEPRPRGAHSRAKTTDAANKQAVAAAAEIKRVAEDARGVAIDSNQRIKVVESEVRKPLVKRLAYFGLVVLGLYFVTSGLVQSRQNGAALSELKAAQQVIVENNTKLTENNERLIDENTLLFEIAREQAELLRDAGLEPVDPFDPGIVGPGTSPGRAPSPGTTQSGPTEGSESPSGGSNGGSGTTTPDEPQAAPSPTPAPSPGVSVRPPNTGLPLPLPSEIVVPVPNLPLGLSAAGSTLPLSSDKETRTMDPNLLNPWLTLLGLLLPVIVGAVTNGGASSTVKGWTLAALSGVSAVLAEWAEVVGDGANFNWREVGMNLLLVFAASVIAYKGGLVREVATKVSNATADKGIGSPVRPMLRDPQTGRFRKAGATDY